MKDNLYKRYTVNIFKRVYIVNRLDLRLLLCRYIVDSIERVSHQMGGIITTLPRGYIILYFHNDKNTDKNDTDHIINHTQ